MANFSGNQQDVEPISLTQLWRTLWKRKLWALAGTMTVALPVSYYAATAPSVYDASAKVLLVQKDKGLQALGDNLAELSEFSSMSRLGSPLDTQAEVMKSVPIIQAVVAQLKLTNKDGTPLKPSAFLANGWVAPVRGTDIIKITYRHSDPTMAQVIVNEWAAAYVRDNQSVHREEASAASTFIAKQLAKTKSELEAAEGKLSQFRQAHKALDMPEQARAAIQTVTDIENQQRQSQALLQEAAARASSLRQKIGLASRTALASTAVSQDANIQQLRQQILAAETNPVLSSSLTPDHPSVVAAQKEVTHLKAKLEQETRKLVGNHYASVGVRDDLDPVRQALTKDLIQAEVEMSGHQTRLASLNGMLSSYNQRITAFPQRVRELATMERNAMMTADLYKMLLQKLEETNIQKAMSIGNTRILEEAELPEAPVEPKRKNLLLAGLLGGAFLGMGAAFIIERLDDSVQLVEDVEQASAVPLLGAIPWSDSQATARLVTRDDPRTPAFQAYQALRSNIKFLATERSIKSIGITSASEGELKSTVIANLAALYASMGQRVVIVDADLHMPTQHQIYHVPNQTGLTSYILGTATLEEALQSVGQENLRVMTSGPIPPNSAKLLESPAMAQLFDKLAESFDVVLFDLPPVLPIIDANIIAPKLDGMVIVAKLGKVSRRAFLQSVQRLTTSNSKVLGVVATGVVPELDSYYYNYHYQYYGKRDSERRNLLSLIKRN